MKGEPWHYENQSFQPQTPRQQPPSKPLHTRFKSRSMQSIVADKPWKKAKNSNNPEPEVEVEENSNRQIQQSKKEHNKHILKATNLQFHTRKNPSNTISTPWTIQNWLPTRTNTILIKNRQIFTKQQESYPSLHQSPSISQQLQSKYQPRDSQSLLRKNSLYLLSIITTKQRKSISIPQVKNTPFVIDKIPASLGAGKDRKERLDRERNFISTLKYLKEEKNIQKDRRRDLPLLPEPW